MATLRPVNAAATLFSPRKAEHPLGDDVALDLRRAAGDGAGEAGEEAEHPPAGALVVVAIDDDPGGALELHPQLEQRFLQLRRRHLEVRVLGRRAALGER